MCYYSYWLPGYAVTCAKVNLSAKKQPPRTTNIINPLASATGYSDELKARKINQPVCTRKYTFWNVIGKGLATVQISLLQGGGNAHFPHVGKYGLQWLSFYHPCWYLWWNKKHRFLIDGLNAWYLRVDPKSTEELHRPSAVKNTILSAVGACTYENLLSSVWIFTSGIVESRALASWAQANATARTTTFLAFMPASQTAPLIYHLVLWLKRTQKCHLETVGFWQCWRVIGLGLNLAKYDWVCFIYTVKCACKNVGLNIFSIECICAYVYWWQRAIKNKIDFFYAVVECCKHVKEMRGSFVYVRKETKTCILDTS